MEDLLLGRIAALVPEFAVKDLGQNTDDDICLVFISLTPLISDLCPPKTK